mmetsp:Transcript_14598/g.27382  ORF Transcript_14598/g.27382 Transcript_14598/m.27382 type:complete len:141 (-) Transcript_14598:79-501(-)
MDASTSSLPGTSPTSPLLSFPTKSAPPTRGISSASSDEMGEMTMVRRLSEISTSSISFDASKLAMYKNFSGRSTYAQHLDGEAVGKRISRRIRVSGYSSSRSAPIAEKAEEQQKDDGDMKKTVIEPVKRVAVSKTTVISL